MPEKILGPGAVVTVEAVAPFVFSFSVLSLNLFSIIAVLPSQLYFFRDSQFCATRSVILQYFFFTCLHRFSRQRSKWSQLISIKILFYLTKHFSCIHIILYQPVF